MAADAATEATSTMTEACGTRTSDAFIDQTPRRDLRATGSPQVGPGLVVVGVVDHGPACGGIAIHIDRPEINSRLRLVRHHQRVGGAAWVEARVASHGGEGLEVRYLPLHLHGLGCTELHEHGSIVEASEEHQRDHRG